MTVTTAMVCGHGIAPGGYVFTRPASRSPVTATELGASPAPAGPHGGRCHHPLTDTPVIGLRPDRAAVRTQCLINTLLTAPDQTVHWPLYEPGGAPTEVVLRDTRCLGDWFSTTRPPAT